MKKPLMIFVLIVILVIVVVGGLIIFNQSSLENGQILSISEKINNCQEDNDCITNLAVELKNESICENISSYEQSRECQLDVFIAIGDISNCERSYYYASCERAILNSTK